MLSINFKKVLMSATALVAVAALPQQAHAVTRNITTVSTQTWGSSGSPSCAATTVSTACSGDDMSFTMPSGSSTLLILDNGVAYDGSPGGFDEFIVGKITDSTSNVGNVYVQNIQNSTALDVTIFSVDINGNFDVYDNMPTSSSVSVDVTKTAVIGGDLYIHSQNDASTDMSVGSTLTVDGVTLIHGEPGDASLIVLGNATFNDTVKVINTSSTSGTSSLTLQGATNVFANGLVLEETNNGVADFTLNGSFAQTVSGTINGGGTGQGSLIIQNANGVTFSGAIGNNYALDNISIYGNGAFNSSATFNANVSAGDIILGDLTGSDTNTLTFNSTGGNITVDANIYGGGGSDVNNVVIAGGKLVTVNGDWGGGGALNSITVNANTSLYLGGTVSNTANGIMLAGSGTTVTVGTSENLQTSIDAAGNYGTLTLEGGTQIVTGTVGATNALATVNAGAAGASSVFQGAVKATTMNFTGDGLIDLEAGLDGSVAFGGNDGLLLLNNGSTITGTVDTTTANTGTLTLSNGGNTVSGAVGGTQALKYIYAGDSGTDTFSSTVNAGTLFVNGTGTVDMTKGLTGDIDFGSTSGTVKIASGYTVSGDIYSTGGPSGTLNLMGGSQTIAGAVGGVGLGLSVINAGQSGGTTIFSNATQAVYATTLNIGTGSVELDGGLVGNANLGSSGGTLTLASGMGVTGNITAVGGTGTLNLLGGVQTIGGATGNFAVVNAGANAATSTFTGLLTTTDLNITGTGTVALDGGLTGSAHFLGDGILTLDNASTITGVVDTANANKGTLVLLNGGNTVSGIVGALAAPLKEIYAGDSGVDTFSSAVYAGVLKVTGAGTVAMAGMTGNIDFGGNGGTVTMASGTDITGAVNNSTGTGGTLSLLGSTQTVTGLVGATGALSAINAGLSGGDATFLSYVKAATLNVGNGSVTLNGLTGSVDFGGNNGTLNLASGTTLTGNIDNLAGSGGTLNLQGGTQTISGFVGATGALALIDTGVTGSDTTFSKTVNATTIDISGTGAVHFNDDVTGSVYFYDDGVVNLAAGKSFTGDIDNALASPATGNFIFDSSASMLGSIGATGPLNSLTLAGTGGTVGTNGVGQLVTVAGGNVAIADTTDLGGNTLAVTGGTVSSVSGQTIMTQMTGAVSSGTVVTGGNITSSGAATIATGTNVDVNVQSLTSYVQDLATFTVVNGTGGTGVGTVNITDNSYLFNFTQGGSTSDLDLIVNRVSLASLANTWNNIQVGTALDTIGSSATGSLMTAQIALQNAPNATVFNNTLARLLPTVDNSARVAALNVGGVTASIVETRMAELRQGTDGTMMAMTGVSAGYDDGFISGENVWAQVYGQKATQDSDSKTGVAGYTSSTMGGAFGVDSSNVLNGAVVGLAFNYAQTDADSKNLNRTATNVDSYGVSLYTSYDLGEELFMNAQVGYAYNSIGSVRHDVVTVGDAANADYESTQYTAKVSVGDDIAVDYAMTMSPSISLDYAHLSNGSYEETGIGTAGLRVDASDYSLMRLGMGINTEWNLRNWDGSILKPALRFGYSYDIINDNVETTSHFIGAPTTLFVTRGPEPSSSTFSAGTGITYMTTSNWDLSANYDYTYKDKYSAHAGIARATARF